MKNFTVRLAVLVLSATGFTASTVISKASVKVSAVPQVVGSAPVCGPRDPSHCGID